MNKIKIDVCFKDNEIFVEAIMQLSKKYNDVSFSISKLLSIDSIISYSNEIIYDRKEVSLTFQHPSYEYHLHDIDKIINIKYHGEIKGWLNHISEDIKALSMYSSWYPMFNIDVDDVIITIKNIDNQIVIKGNYNGNTKTWKYDSKNYDTYNIIALKNNSYNTISSDSTNIYYCDEEEKEIATNIAQSLGELLNFFNGNLFTKKRLNKCDIVSFSKKISNGGGAYKRKDLIVAESLPKDKNDLMCHLGHEYAHEWCTGADSNTYHDWLNETTAEWASLLFFLKNNNYEYFESSISHHNDYAMKSPSIKTQDGSRPSEGVHNKGVILFYEIYKKYDAKVIEKLLKIYDELECKNTENYIIEIQNYNPDIASIIEEGIL